MDYVNVRTIIGPHLKTRYYFSIYLLEVAKMYQRKFVTKISKRMNQNLDETYFNTKIIITDKGDFKMMFIILISFFLGAAYKLYSSVELLR